MRYVTQIEKHNPPGLCFFCDDAQEQLVPFVVDLRDEREQAMGGDCGYVSDDEEMDDLFLLWSFEG